MAERPKVNSDSQKELDRADKNFQAYDENVKNLVEARSQPKESPEHKISQSDIEKSPDLYMKPQRIIMSREKFNEEYREQYNEAKKYVQYTVQNEEAKGDVIEMWTKCFPGMAAEFWVIPSGKPVWIPKYVAEKLENGCGYHRLKTENTPTFTDNKGSQYFGTLVVDEYIHRISARPVSTKKSFAARR